MATLVEEDRYSIVEQCNKLVKLDQEAEQKLLKTFPEPKIMIRKQGGPLPVAKKKTKKQLEKEKRKREKKMKKKKTGKRR